MRPARREYANNPLPRRPLVAILLLFLLLAALYMAVTPPFEGPDEPQHFAYVVWLVEEGRLPPQGEAAWQTPLQQEAGQPPLYYALASLPARLTGVTDPEATFHPNPHLVGPFPRLTPDNDNRAIHYPDEEQHLAGGWLAFYLARLVSLLHGVLLLVAVYGLTHELFPGTATVWLATLLVALIPQVIFLSIVVSNDIPVAAWSAVTLWAAVRLLHRGPTLLRALALGVLFGLAALTKISALTVALPLGLAHLWLWRQQLPSRRTALRNALASVAATLAVAGWWFAGNWARYGSPLGLSSHDPSAWAIVGEQPHTLAARWWEVFRSFWIWLGWGTVRPDFRVYYVLAALVLLALSGLIWQWLQRRTALQAGRPSLAILATGLLSIAVFLEIWMNRVVAPYGRLTYPVLALVAILLVLGWQALHSRLVLLPLGLLALLAFLAPFQVLRPAYAAPAPLSAQETASLTPRLNLTFLDGQGGPVVELLSATPERQSAAPGEVVPVTVCLRPRRQTEQELSLVVQLIGPENQLVASRHTYPGLGRYPSSIWEPGAVFCDPVHVQLSANVERTLAYQVEIAMLWQDGGQRLSIVDAAGNALSNAFVARVRIATRETEPVARSGDSAISLLDFRTPATWRVGETQPLVLTWAVHATFPADYQVYVHLRPEGQGDEFPQDDGPPLDGWYPTSWWQAGETVVDERQFSLPAGTPPGDYRLYTGFYDLATGERVSQEFDLGPIRVIR